MKQKATKKKKQKEKKTPPDNSFVCQGYSTNQKHELVSISMSDWFALSRISYNVSSHSRTAFNKTESKWDKVHVQWNIDMN